MSRPTFKRSRTKWSGAKSSGKNETSSSKESSSFTDNSPEYSPRVKNTSTPLKARRSDLDGINRSRRGQGRSKNSSGKELSSDEKEQERFRRNKERERHRHDRERVVERQKVAHEQGTRETSAEDTEDEDEDEEPRKTSGSSESSEDRYGGSDAERANRRRKRNAREKKRDNELPITEILRRSQESARTKYEHQPPPLSLPTTDKVYIQHRGGFSVVKIHRKSDSRDGRKSEADEGVLDVSQSQSPPPIRVAIMIQQFWRKTGSLHQGLLAGMALMHFIMMHTFYETSMDFMLKYSLLNEIYTTIFSFLLAMCIVSMFDKFDLARFDMEHLRELYMDYNRAIVAIPLYLAIFCLHQACARTDNQLNWLHYYRPNGTLWENVTSINDLQQDLSSWQKITLSKDLLAVLAWLFVSLGNKDDAFLMYLQSMEKYAHDTDSFVQ